MLFRSKSPSTPSAPPTKDEEPSSTANRFRFNVSPSLLDSFQEYFFLCVTSVVESAEDKKFACPVRVFLACFGYNEDDTFKMPPELTTHLAGWQYLLRCTALFEAVRLEKANKVESALK